MTTTDDVSNWTTLALVDKLAACNDELLQCCLGDATKARNERTSPIMTTPPTSRSPPPTFRTWPAASPCATGTTRTRDGWTRFGSPGILDVPHR
jgi:hypothetical protein